MFLQNASKTLGSMLLIATILIAPAYVQAGTQNYSATAPDGVSLAVQESGNPDGPTIVFIHGLLGSHLNWEKQVDSPILQRYRIITYDMRGHGQSGKPSAANAYSEGTRWADDLAAVMKTAKVNKPVLVGWSLGGTVISNYLAEYGDKQISGAVYVDGVIEFKPELITAHPEIYKNLNATDLKTHLDSVREFLELCFHTRPDGPTFERLFANAAMASWDMQKAVMTMDIKAVEGLGSAKVPVLLLYGAHDALVQSTAAIARATHLNPGVKSKLYENSGHAPFLEEPERFNRDLAAFIDASLKR